MAVTITQQLTEGDIGQAITLARANYVELINKFVKPAMTTRLNGWYRLWIVLCVPLLVFAVLTVKENWWLSPKERLEIFAEFGLIPCLLLYALGWSVVWIIRGFNKHSH